MNLTENVRLMHASPRCGARTRAGGTCNAPAVRGRTRCRMHGGAKGSGAPTGNKNALKHGEFAGSTVALKKKIAALIKRTKQIIDEL